MATRGRSQPAARRLAAIVAGGLAGTICIAWGGWRVGALVGRGAQGRWLGGTPVLRSVPLPPRVVCFVLWGVGLALLSLAWWALHEIARKDSQPAPAASPSPPASRSAAPAPGPPSRSAAPASRSASAADGAESAADRSSRVPPPDFRAAPFRGIHM